MGMTLLFFITLFSLLGGCQDDPVNIEIVEKQIWQEVEQFRGIDIRYLKKEKDVLYLSAYKHSTIHSPFVNALLKTEDGVRWDTMKVFERIIGPIAFNGDTLTVLEDGRTWKYHPSFGWIMFWRHFLLASRSRDMVWLNGKLFVFDNTEMVFQGDSGRDLEFIPGSPAESRFVKHVLDGREVGYTRPFYIYKDDIYKFDGEQYDIISASIDEQENILPNYPCLFIHNNELYAGFNTPSRIKKYNGKEWLNITDTFGNTIYANMFTPPLSNRPTAMCIDNARLFVGTEWAGVLEWRDSSWMNISTGLPFEFPDYPDVRLYKTVSQMQSLRGRLFVAYGEPFSAYVHNGRGLFTYSEN